MWIPLDMPTMPRQETPLQIRSDRGARDSPHGEAVGPGPGEHKALGAEADGG